MMIIDTHAHVYKPYFDEDLDQIIKNAVDAGVQKIFIPNINVDSIQNVLEAAQNYPGVCYPMVGLHPCEVKEDFQDQLNILEAYLKKHKFFAIGEIGMDLYWDLKYKNQQIEALKIQIDWALEYGLPVAIHSRNANDEVVEIFSKLNSKKRKGVFHCFSGTLTHAETMIELGFYLGIGGVVTYKNGGLDKVLENISLDHIVLETDSPYLSPVPYRGKRNEPSYINLIIKRIAEIKGLMPDEVREITTNNSKKLFQIQ